MILNYLHKFFSLACLVILTACVPMGMPELYTAENSSPMNSLSQSKLSSRGYRPAALVVLPRKADAYSVESKPVRKTLGYQYLLGAFPFTRLFFQHGIENFLTEATLQSFIAQGFQTYVTTEQNLPAVLSQLCPYASVRIDSEKVRVNAYDLFLTRKLSIQAPARLQAWVVSAGGGVIPKSYDLNIDSTSFKKYALAPSLSYATEIAFVDAVDGLLKDEKISRELQGVAVCRATSTSRSNRLNFIPLPNFEFDSEDMAKAFHDSYGFTSFVSTSASLKRSVQRGIESYFSKQEIPFLSSQAIHPKPKLSSFNQLSSSVTKIEIIENVLVLDMSLEFSERQEQQEGSQLLIKENCSSETALDYSLDGYLFFALEKAVKNIVSAVFTQKPVQGISCN